MAENGEVVQLPIRSWRTRQFILQFQRVKVVPRQGKTHSCHACSGSGGIAPLSLNLGIRRVTLLENPQEHRMKELHHEHRYHPHSKASAMTVMRLRIKLFYLLVTVLMLPITVLISWFSLDNIRMHVTWCGNHTRDVIKYIVVKRHKHRPWTLVNACDTSQ